MCPIDCWWMLSMSTMLKQYIFSCFMIYMYEHKQPTINQYLLSTITFLNQGVLLYIYKNCKYAKITDFTMIHKNKLEKNDYFWCIFKKHFNYVASYQTWQQTAMRSSCTNYIGMHLLCLGSQLYKTLTINLKSQILWHFN